MESVRTLEGELLAHDDARYDAMTRCDVSELEHLLADKLRYTHSTGAVESKAQYLAALACGRVRYLAVKRDLDSLATYDGCAVMQGRLEVQAVVAGREFVVRTVFTSTWVRQDAGWQMAAWAATLAPR